MNKITILEPLHIDELLELMSRYQDDIMPVAGGTDVLVDIRNGKKTPPFLLDLSRIDSLNFLEKRNEIQIGATNNLNSLVRSTIIRNQYRMFAEAAGCIGSFQIRNLATVGGNICNAVPSADLAPSLLAGKAKVIIKSENQEKIVPISEFFIGPRKTIRKNNEIVVGFLLPQVKEITGSAYLRFTPRRALDLAVVGVAVMLRFNRYSWKIEEAGIALGAVAPIPIRVETAERMAIGNAYSDDLVEEVANLCVQSSRPISDTRASADYRKYLVSVMVKRAMAQAFQRSQAIMEGEMAR